MSHDLGVCTIRVMGRVNPVVTKWQRHVLVYFFVVVDVYNVAPIAKHYELDKSFRENEGAEYRKIPHQFIMNVIAQIFYIIHILNFIKRIIKTVVP